MTTVQPAYTERFGATKTVPYSQKNHISENTPARKNTTT